MRTFRRIAAFLLICVCMSALLKFMLVPSSYMRIALHEVQDPKQNYDIIFAGQSHGELAFDPEKIEEKTGKTVYNLARRQIVMRDVEYVVKEANYHNNPSMVIYDMDPAYWLDSEKPNYYGDSYMFPHLKNPVNKIEYFCRYNLNTDFRMTLFPYWVCGSEDIKKIKTTVQDKASKYYWEYSIKSVQIVNKSVEYRGKGFWYQDEQTNAGFSPIKWEDEKVTDSARESFQNMVTYCKKNNIAFICISSPLPMERKQQENYSAAHDYISKLCKEYEVPFWDFNYLTPEKHSFDIEGEKVFIDKDGHLLGSTAEKYSLLLGDMLASYMQGKEVNSYFTYQ